MTEFLISLIKKTKELCDKCTPGPWIPDDNNPHSYRVTNKNYDICEVWRGAPGYQFNRVLISLAREVLPIFSDSLFQLIKENEKLKNENETLRKQRDEVDALITEYGIDTVGTGPGVSGEEDARVNQIIDAARQRQENKGENI